MPQGKNDNIEVRAYERRRPRLGTEKREGDESFVAELPVIAPEQGVNIVDARQEREQPSGRGVKRVGGADHGKIDKGVKRVGRKR